MSALYVKCPKCGPLCSFIPQGGQFQIEFKCSCGATICHTENCNNSQPKRQLQSMINGLKGKHTVDPMEDCFT